MRVRYHCGMKPVSPRAPKQSSRGKRWADPVKDHAPKDSTLSTSGDFQQFAQIMRKIVNKKQS